MKDIFLIKGLGGKRTLKGTLPVYGAKNAALPAFASALLFKDGIKIDNVPYIEDIKSIAELIEDIGGEVKRESAHSWKVSIKSLKKTELNRDLAKNMRASIVLSGPILARYGKVSFPHPGGCVLGERPVDIFLDAFAKMGAKITLENELYTISTDGKKLRGAEIFLRVPSHTATETLMMAATLAEGVTVIKNAAMEPEMANIAEFLSECGAKIEGAGTSTITIKGGTPLTAQGKVFHTIPDRIETGSFLILAALAADNITITDCEPKHLESLTDVLIRSGVPIQISKNAITVKYPAGSKNSDLRSFNVKTHEYPGFPTDLQAPVAVFLTQVGGESHIFETIFEGRLNYAADLEKMGAKVGIWSQHTMTTKGPTILIGRKLFVPYIRAGLSYVLAAITAKGRSVINNVHFIDRGYERIEERLKAVGVDIERVAN